MRQRRISATVGERFGKSGSGSQKEPLLEDVSVRAAPCDRGSAALQERRRDDARTQFVDGLRVFARRGPVDEPRRRRGRDADVRLRPARAGRRFDVPPDSPRSKRRGILPDVMSEPWTHPRRRKTAGVTANSLSLAQNSPSLAQNNKALAARIASLHEALVEASLYNTAATRELIKARTRPAVASKSTQTDEDPPLEHSPPKYSIRSEDSRAARADARTLAAEAGEAAASASVEARPPEIYRRPGETYKGRVSPSIVVRVSPSIVVRRLAKTATRWAAEAPVAGREAVSRESGAARAERAKESDIVLSDVEFCLV